MSHLVEPRIAQDDEGTLVVVAREEPIPRVTELHAHARGQLIGSLRGLVTIETPAGQWIVPVSHAAWVPPRISHGLASHGPFTGWSVYVPEAACADLPSHPLTLEVSGLLREAIVRASSWTPGSSLDASQTRIGEVILDEIRTAREQPLQLRTPSDSRLRKIVRQILRNPADNRSLQAWASFANVSTRTLTRQFRGETGLSLSEWKQQARLLRALELLASGAPVSSISFELGYETPSAFIAMFQRAFGMTPGRFAAGEGARPGSGTSGAHARPRRARGPA